jgi:hypothetical protein
MLVISGHLHQKMAIQRCSCRYTRMISQQPGADCSELARLRKENVGISIYADGRCAYVLMAAVQERLRDRYKKS